jgi:hypothetical protein
VVKKQPELKGIEVAKALGAMWRELSDEGKKPYIDLSAGDKKRYEKEMETYKSGITASEE